MKGGTYSQLVEIQRIVALGEIKLRALNGRVSVPVSGELLAAQKNLVDALHRIRVATRVAKEELHAEVAP